MYLALRLVRSQNALLTVVSTQQEEAWTATIAMLEANNVDAAAKLFAATTLKGKVWFPLHFYPIY